MSDIKFSISLRCDLNSGGLYAYKILNQEKIKDYTVKKDGAGYIISSPFLSLNKLKSSLKKFYMIIPKIGNIDKNYTSYIKFTYGLNNNPVKILLNLDYEIFLEKYPSLSNSILSKYEKIIEPGDFTRILGDNAVKDSFFRMKEYNCLPYKVEKGFISLRLLGSEFKIEDLDELGEYIKSTIKKKDDNKFNSLVNRFNDIVKNSYPFKKFKNKYNKINFYHDVNDGKNYLSKVWYNYLPSIKKLFWYNDIPNIVFDLNWNSSVKKLEIRKLNYKDLYLKEIDLSQNKLENCIIINSHIHNTSLKNCYVFNCYIFQSKISNSYLDRSFWNTNTIIDNNTFISKDDKNISKDYDITAEDSELVKNFK